MIIRLIGAILLILVYCSGVNGQVNTNGKPLKVRAIYPSGEEVATSDRITIEFNQNIVALGASMFIDDVVPVDIEPAVECEWNWVKLNTLQCELPIDSNLNGATRYQVTVRPGIKAPNGQMMDEEYVHQFDTVLPAISSSRLISWKSPNHPIFNVWFNQKIDLDSLKERLLLFDSVSGKEISTKICPDRRRLRSEFREDYFGRNQTYQIFDRSECEINGVNTDDVIILSVEPLSPKSDVSLILLPGVQGATGTLTSSERVVIDAETKTFDEFRLLGLVCQNVFGDDIFLEVDKSYDSKCKVRSSFRLVFSTPFLEREINEFVHIQPQDNNISASAFRSRFGLQTFGGYEYSISGDFQSDSTYRIFLASTEQSNESDDGKLQVKDGFGRPLVGTNEVTFQTERPSPRTSVNPRNVVVASDSTVDPKISFGNVDEVSIIYDILDELGVQTNQIQHRQSSDQDDVMLVEFLGLRDALRSPSGVMSGRVVSRPRFEYPDETIESRFFAQATPYSVYLKIGTVSSLAWVVDLQTGEPIANANVELYLGNPQYLAENRDSIFSSQTSVDGLVSLPGYETFDRDWDRTIEYMFWNCEERDDCPKYFLRVEGDLGVALLPLDDDYELYGSTYLPSIDENLDHFATTSQNLYRPGDMVHIKGYVRTRRNEVRMVPDEGYFGLCIRGPQDVRDYEISPITLNEFGAYHTSFNLTNRSEFGEYRIILVFDPDTPVSNPCSYRFYDAGGTFEVYEFSTNSIQVTQHLNHRVFERGNNLIVTTQAEFHAGGPYAHAQSQLVVSVEPKHPPIETVSKYDYTISDHPIHRHDTSIYDGKFQLDEQGNHTTTIDSIESEVYYGELRFESSVISDRGKAIASRIIAPYFGVDQFVAIRQPISYDIWLNYGRIRANELWPIQVLVISKDDTIVTEKNVQITVFAAQEDSNREDSLFWSRSSDTTWDEVFQCEVTSAEDSVSCDFTPTEKNYYRIEAQIEDTKGNFHVSSLWLETYIDDRPRPKVVERAEQVELELQCSSAEVMVGDLIQCEVKNYRENTPMLVTIERTSVIDEWLVRLDPNKPIIEFPVLEHYEPHFALSVLAFSPLSETSLWGHTRYQVEQREFTLDNPRLRPFDITVSSNRATYSPRDTVKLSISAKKDAVKPIEYTVAVIDEAILDLSKTGDIFFDPTLKEWTLVESEVRTYGLISSLLEKSHLQSPTPLPYQDTTARPMRGGMPSYMATRAPELSFEGEKTSNPNVRELHEFVAYWNPSVVSASGRLKLDFVLPDNLTRWRVLVMAVSADDRFGHANTSFASIKDTEVRAVVPNVVTEGDTFQIGASILNRANRQRRLHVNLDASGGLHEDSNTSFERQLTFKPFERKVVSWDVAAASSPVSLDVLRPINTPEIKVIASAGDRRDLDALDVRIPIRSNRVRVSSVAYGMLHEDKTTIPISIPSKVADESGRLDFTLTTNEAVNLDGVFRYAIEYPYSCWEQELTKAVLALQYIQLKKQGVKHDTQWLDAEQQIEQVLASAVDYQYQNGGMVYFVTRSQRSAPYLSAYTAIAFSWLEDAGYEVPVDVKRELLEYLRNYLDDHLQELQEGVQEGNEVQLHHLDATIGAVVMYALAIWKELKENELTLYSNQINQMDLFGLSHYLLASLTQNPTSSLNNKIFDRIMNHRSLVDGAVEFVESVPLGFTQILHSDTRSLCSVLTALTQLSESKALTVELGELKELSNTVRYARENLPYWRNTQDNVFCTNALIAFFDYVDSDISDLVASVDLRNTDTGVSTRLVDGWKFSSSIAKLHSKHTLQSQIFDSRGNIEIRRNGNGTAFYNVELSYLTTVDERINRFSGFEIHREYVVYRDDRWYVLSPDDPINKGEYVLVNLYLNNRFDRNHVVVDDTVPGGLEPVNLNLSTEFLPPFSDWELEYILSASHLFEEFREARHWSFRYRELGLQNVRYFASSIRRGKYHLSWLGQAIVSGEFTVLPTHVEEMYRPIMFGKSEAWTLKIEP